MHDPIIADGLSGLKDAIGTAFPKTEHQRCIVHMVRNTLKYVASKEMKEFARDLRTIYTAPDEKTALARLETVTKHWDTKYPNAMNRWRENWDAISPIFKFSTTVRKCFYTTNAIESLNATYRHLNRQRSIFPSSTALLKALYLATFEATKKWTMPVRFWGQVRGELSLMYPDRFPDWPVDSIHPYGLMRISFIKNTLDRKNELWYIKCTGGYIVTYQCINQLSQKILIYRNYFILS